MSSFSLGRRGLLFTEVFLKCFEGQEGDGIFRSGFVNRTGIEGAELFG